VEEGAGFDGEDGASSSSSLLQLAEPNSLDDEADDEAAGFVGVFVPATAVAATGAAAETLELGFDAFAAGSSSSSLLQLTEPNSLDFGAAAFVAAAGFAGVAGFAAAVEDDAAGFSAAFGAADAAVAVASIAPSSRFSSHASRRTRQHRGSSLKQHSMWLHAKM
jgi:hypothetical protein